MRSPYAFGGGSAKTHRWLRVARGSSVRTIPMNIVSNSGFEEREWRHWQQQCERDGVPVPTYLDIDMIVEQLKAGDTCVDQ